MQNVTLDDIARIKVLAVNLQLELNRMPRETLDQKYIVDMKNIVARLNKINQAIYEESFQMTADEYVGLVEVKIILNEIAK